MSLDSNISKCKEFMLMSGLPIFDDINPDGNIHRYNSQSTRHQDKDEWYICHDCGDGNIVMVFSSWNTGKAPDKPYKWTSYQDNTVPEDIARQINQRVAEHQEARKKERDESMERLRQAIQTADITDKHPYLEAKGITGFSVKVSNESIIVPIYNIDGELVGAQAIAPDGTKKNWPKSTCSGGFYTIGDIHQGNVCIAEGYATGISAHQASGKPVIIAFGCSNMARVAEAVIAKGITKTVDLLQDNDQAGDKIAKEWENKNIGTVYKTPDLEEGNDWNDAAKELGLEAVRNLFLSMDEELWQNTSWQSFSFEEFYKQNIPPLSWCMENFMTQGSVNVIAGAGGVGKSMVASDIATAACIGQPVFYGWRGDRKGQRVLVVDGELPAATFKSRWDMCLNRWGITNISGLTLMPVLMFVDDHPDPNLYLPIHRRKLDKLIEANDLIVLDNFNCLCRRLSGDGDTYQADENKWTELYLWMRRWCAKGKTFLFVMHLTKGGALQGTSRIHGDAETVVQLNKLRSDLKENIHNLGVVFEFTKGRNITPDKQEPFAAEMMTVDEVRKAKGVYDRGGPWLCRTVKYMATKAAAKDISLCHKGVTLDDLFASRMIIAPKRKAKDKANSDKSSDKGDESSKKEKTDDKTKKPSPKEKQLSIEEMRDEVLSRK